MSKEGNMEELQRYWTETDNPHTFSENADGAFVRFSDVEEREARFQARIEELEGIVSGKTMYDAAAAADARWRERIENGLYGNPGPDSFRAYMRSLLDSGEEREYPDCAGEEIRGCSRCDGSGRANPSPALEGREDEGTYRRDPDGCYVCGVDEYAARARGRAESGLPVSQGMVRDGEVIARLHNLDSHRNPHWSDEENRAYSLGVRNAIHVIEHPEEENQSAEAGQPRSVLAREGGNGE